MAKTQAKSQELDSSIEKQAKEGFEDILRKQGKSPAKVPKDNLEERIHNITTQMEKAKEFYLRSVGALETLYSLKQEKSREKGE